MATLFKSWPSESSRKSPCATQVRKLDRLLKVGGQKIIATQKAIKDATKKGDPDNKLPYLKSLLKFLTEEADKIAKEKVRIEKTARKVTKEDRLIAIPEVSFFRKQRGKAVAWALRTGAFGGLLDNLLNSVRPVETKEPF